MKNGNPNIYRPPGGRSEREVAAEVCVRVLESGLVQRTPEVIYRLAVAVGVPVDLIRRTWTVAPARRSVLGEESTTDIDPIRPLEKIKTGRQGQVQDHSARKAGSTAESAEDRFERRKRMAQPALKAKEPVPGKRVCSGKLCNGELRGLNDFVVKDKKTQRLSSWCRSCIKVYQAQRYLSSKRIEQLGPVLDFILQDGDADVGELCVECGEACVAGDQVVASHAVLRHARHVELKRYLGRLRPTPWDILYLTVSGSL